MQWQYAEVTYFSLVRYSLVEYLSSSSSALEPASKSSMSAFTSSATASVSGLEVEDNNIQYLRCAHRSVVAQVWCTSVLEVVRFQQVTKLERPDEVQQLTINMRTSYAS